MIPAEDRVVSTVRLRSSIALCSLLKPPGFSPQGAFHRLLSAEGGEAFLKSFEGELGDTFSKVSPRDISYRIRAGEWR